MIFRGQRTIGLSLENGKLSVAQCLHRKGAVTVEKSLILTEKVIDFKEVAVGLTETKVV